MTTAQSDGRGGAMMTAPHAAGPAHGPGMAPCWSTADAVPAGSLRTSA